jgi:hypothetical protein
MIQGPRLTGANLRIPSAISSFLSFLCCGTAFTDAVFCAMDCMDLRLPYMKINSQHHSIGEHLSCRRLFQAGVCLNTALYFSPSLSLSAIDSYHASPFLRGLFCYKVRSVCISSRNQIAYFPSPSSVIALVPYELWAFIFGMVLPPFAASPSRHSRARRELENVCQAWRVVLRSSPLLWTGVRFDYSHHPDYIKSILDFSRPHPVDFSLKISHTVRFPADVFCLAIQRAMNRARVADFEVQDLSSLKRVSLLLRHIPFTSLQKLVLHYTAPFPNRRMRSYPQILMHSPLDDLRILVLRRVAFAWIPRHSFRSLTCLVLMDLLVYPSWAEYSCLAQSATSLARLCIRNVGCVALTTDPEERLVFPSLEQLDLTFGSDPTTTRVARNMSAPILEHVRFHGRSPLHFISFALCHGLLDTVKKLTLSGMCNDGFTSHFIFLSVPFLESLEILNFDDCVLSSILIADNVVMNRDEAITSACPLLNTLTVSHATPSEIREFMERRQDCGSAIRRVDFRGGAFQWLYDATDLAWVGSRAYVGSLPRYRDDSWISGLSF